MAIMPFNFTTVTTALLSYHLTYARQNNDDWLDALDNTFDGNIDQLASIDIDECEDSGEYDEITALLFFDDATPITDDDIDLMRRWVQDDDFHERLTELYKAHESSARQMYSLHHPTIDDI